MKEKSNTVKKSHIIVAVILLLSIILITFITFFFLSLHSISTEESLDTAAIDEETGNFAVEWFDSYVHINTYDASGNLLFKLNIPFSETAGGIANLNFKDGFLHVQYFRNKIETVYDMSGSLIEKSTCDSESINGTWHQFKQTIEKDGVFHTATINGTTYQYRATRLFKSLWGVHNFFCIKNDVIGEVIVWDCKLME